MPLTDFKGIVSQQSLLCVVAQVGVASSVGVIGLVGGFLKGFKLLYIHFSQVSQYLVPLGFGHIGLMRYRVKFGFTSITFRDFRGQSKETISH